MAEVFRVWGTFSLREEGGPIDQRINDIGGAANQTTRQLDNMSNSFDDLGGASRDLNRLADGFSDIENSARGLNEISNDIDDIGDAANDTESSFSGLEGAFDDVGGAAGAAGAIISAAFIAVLVESIDVSRDFEKAVADVARRTNATTKETDDYKKSLDDLFKSGFTTDINDLSEAFSISAVQTGKTGDKLEDFTKKTIKLSEKLETDYGETIRAVDGIATDFGITHDEVFNILAKGYDENLNVGGDLIDLFKEYGPILQKIGIDENDMLSILVSSREKGIFSYDELLDGVKEFQIQIFELLQDEEAAKEFFNQLGIKASDVKTAFAEGGEEANKMSGRIILALSEIDDPIEQSKIGVGLYGTKWEDTAGTINDVMLNSKYRVVETKDSMDDLIETDTDPLAKEWNEFYNTFKTDVEKPLGKVLGDMAVDVLDFVNKSDGYINDGLDSFDKSMDKWEKDVLNGLDNFNDWSADKLDEWGDILADGVNTAGDFVVNAIEDMVDESINQLNELKNFINPISDAFNSLGGVINGVIGKISSIKFPSKPSWIPGFATGVEDFDGGLALVGEDGPELTYLPPGSNVYKNQDTNVMLDKLKNPQSINNLSTVSTSGGNTYNVNMQINAESITGIQKLIELLENIEIESLTSNL